MHHEIVFSFVVLLTPFLVPSTLSRVVNTTTPFLLSTAAHQGLSFDVCTPSSRCKGQRICSSVDSGLCFSGENTCFCFPRRVLPCSSNAVCPSEEICAQSDLLRVFCASARAVRSLSIFSRLPRPKKLPSSGRTFDDCDNSRKSRCKPGLSCRVINSGLECRGERNCGCTPRRQRRCFRSRNCPIGEICAQVPSSISRVSICVAKPAVRRWIGFVPVRFPVTRGYSLEPCSFDSQCVAPRKCLRFFPRSPTARCTEGSTCACLIPKISQNRCRRTEDCRSRREVCADTAFFRGSVCVSILARDAYENVEQVESNDVCPVLIKRDPPRANAPAASRSLNSSMLRVLSLRSAGQLSRTTGLFKNEVRLGDEDQPVIVGGLLASRNLQRSMVIIINSDSSQCSGVLISATWLLTAAHCQITRSSRVFVGLSVLNREIEQRAKVIRVRRVRNHPQFRLENRSRNFDIAVVQLRRSVPRFARPIRVNRKLGVPTNRVEVRAIGYGLTSPIGRRSGSTLRQVDLRITPSAECNKQSRRLLFSRQTFRRLKICAESERERCGPW